MFSIGQLVFYGQTGVCEVVNIFEKEIVRGQKREYYELKPIYQSASVIFCPTDSEKVNIRPIISYDEAKKLIELIPTITTDEFKADEQRRLTEKYSAALKGQSCEELISLTKAIYEKKQTAMEKNKENSFYSQFIPIQKRHEFVVTHGIYYAKKKSVFEDYLLTFIVNETEKSFILPIKGLYEFDINGMPAIILPISPTVAICLYDKSFVSDIFDNAETPILKVNKPELIEKMNEVAFITQKQRKYGYVISTQKEELYRIKEKLSICL